MTVYWGPGEIARYIADYSRHNAFVADCCNAVNLDASPALLAMIVAEYGDDVLLDAECGGSPDWLIGRPWQASGLRHAVVVRLDDYRQATNTEGPPAA
jgi:hypothetical protein